MGSGNSRSEPLGAWRFAILFVEPARLEGLTAGGLSAAELAAGPGFSECSGLEVALEVVEYREGGLNDRVHRFPGGVSAGRLVLTRGLGAECDLWDWLDECARGRGRARAGVVALLDGAGGVARAWGFRDAVPVRWSGPQLDALRSRVALERLELAHAGLVALPA
ncbi:MAG: phage tail protein [Planctomycetes bacterium]|nr:phage tail protein [Planctomycetota bacterium]